MCKTMIIKPIFIAYVALIISLVSVSKCDPLTTKASAAGFTTDLIHRDSLKSPFYDPSLSPSQRRVNAIRRSFNRIQRFNLKISPQISPKSDITNSNGEYLMKYSVGIPPVPSLGIADTGSDLIWTQCKPCQQCFKQKLPLFDPKSSSTYKTIPCDTIECSSAEGSCSSTSKNCYYIQRYGDGSFTTGDLSKDTITLAATDGGNLSITNVVIGCGTRNGGIFDGGESGIVGLGGGRFSLVGQFLGYDAKFSYCLVPSLDKSSKLSFADDAVVSGAGVVSIPLVRKEPDTFYYVTLLGISVGNQKLETSNDSSNLIQEGNIIVDSGTTLAILPFDLYYKLKEAMQKSIKLKQIDDPRGVLDLCFSTTQDIIQIPDITVHFKGADVKWKQENIFIRTTNVSLCLAAAPAAALEGLAIYGNLAQTNFLVGFDHKNKIVSFKPTDCGKH